MDSHIFDWDIEGYALSNDPAGISKAAIVAKSLKDKSIYKKYPLKQIIILPTTGTNSTAIDFIKITKTDIDAVTETEDFSSAGQNVIKDFYDIGVPIIANGMVMEYVWRTNYDSQVVLEIGGMAKTIRRLNPTWTNDQVYSHIGITPMIGHQSNAEGIYTFGQGVDTTAKWVKEFGIGFLGFWSLTRDHPLKSGESWKNNPTSYGLHEGTDYIYTNNLLMHSYCLVHQLYYYLMKICILHLCFYLIK